MFRYQVLELCFLNKKKSNNYNPIGQANTQLTCPKLTTNLFMIKIID